MNAFLAAALVKATILLLATALVLRVSSRASAASRHAVALLGLGGALAVPVLGLILPRWEVPLLPTRAVFAPAPARVPRLASSRKSGGADSLAGFTGPVGVQVAPLDDGLGVKARRATPASFAVDAAKIATTLWVLGALVPLAALAVGFRRAAALVRNARPSQDPGLVGLAGEISERLSLTRAVPVLLSAEITVPMTARLFRPVLLLPEAARLWPEERQRVVLLHELAHVARRDLGAFLVSELATASYWFHPLAHFVAAQLRRSAEEASDDLVLGNGTRASDYASHLLGIVRGFGGPGSLEAMPVLAMVRPSDLEDRVRAILDPARRRKAPSRLAALSLSAAGVAGAVLLAAVAPGVARPAAAETVAVSPGKSGSAAYARAKELHDDGRYLEAAESYRKAVELGYREQTAAYNAACAYARAGRKDDAFVWLNKSIELGFDVERYLRKDDDLDSLRKDPRFADLKKAARSAKAEGSESARATRRFERLSADGSKSGARWYDVGKELLDGDRLEASEKAFRTAASLGYRVGASTYNAACALARAGKVPQALDTLDAALEAGFDDPSLIEKDDDLEALRGDPRFARLEKKAEELTLSISDVESGFSRLFRRRSAWRDEIPRFAAYAKAHPESGRAQYNLGYAQLLAERPEAALPAFMRALELGFRKPATLYNLACAHAQLREKDRAFDFLFQAIDAGYDSPGQIRNDDDLDPLREDPRFQRALERAKARKTDGAG